MAQDPPCRWITTRDGLPSNHVYWSMQDWEGLMWFGTDAGAARYDGSHFEVFNSSNGAADNEVLKLYEDSKGRIWFLSINGELSYWWQGSMHNATTDPVLAEVRLRSGISSCLEHRDGSLWFGGYAGDLVRLSPDLAKAVDIELTTSEIPWATIELFPGEGDSLWVMCGEEMYAVHAGHVTPLGRIPRPTNMILSGALPSLGPVVTTLRGLVPLHHLETPLASVDGLPSFNDLRWLSSDRSGDLWWSLFNGGLVRTFWDGRILQADPPQFAQERVTSVYEDKDGNHWIATSTHGVGVMAREQRMMRFHSTSSGSGPEGIMSIFLTSNSDLLCGTDKGRLLRLTPDGLAQPPGAEHLPDMGRILCITGRGDRVWIAQDEGVHTFMDHGGEIHPGPVLFKLEGDPDTKYAPLSVKAIAVGPKDEVVGTYNVPCVIEFQGTDRWRGIMPVQAHASPSRIYTPFFDASGDLWFDRENSLYQVHEGREIEHSELNDILQVRISDIVAIDDSTLAVGSAGSGIAILTHGRLVARLTQVHGLASDQCRQMAVRNGHLLVATASGVSIVPLPLGSAAIRNWSVNNGLPTNDIYCVEGDTANVFVGSAEGLIVLPYSLRQQPGAAPALRFSLISYADTNFRPDARTEIPFGTERVTVKAHAPWFGDPELIEYAFRTTGNAPWQTCANGVVTLASWGSGELVVEMRARAVGSDWSAPIALTLNIPPPWYHRTVVQVIAVMLAIAVAGFGMHMISRRRFRRTLQRLEKEYALAEERRRIAEDVHDDLGADLSHLLMMARLAKVGKPGSITALDQIEHISDRMVQKIDDIVWSLDPRSDPVNATLEHIHQQTGAQCERTGVAFRSSVGIDPRNRQLGAQQRRDLQLAMKELLSNALKHGRPQRIDLLSNVDEGRLHIDLAHDLGDPGPTLSAPNGKGHGLENIQRRLARHGGVFTGPQRSAEGLAWTITLPLEERSA